MPALQRRRDGRELLQVGEHTVQFERERQPSLGDHLLSLYRPRPRSLSGYRQEVRCFSVNVTDGRSEIEPYLTYQSCTQRESEFMGLARFEVKRRPPWFTPGGATARVICGKSVHNGAWTTLDATILANSRPCVCSGAHAAHLCIVFLSGPGEEATARPHPA